MTVTSTSCLLPSSIGILSKLRSHDLPGTVERQDSDDEANEEDNVFDAVPTSTKTKSSGSVLNIKKASVVVNQKYTDRRWTAL